MTGLFMIRNLRWIRAVVFVCGIYALAQVSVLTRAAEADTISTPRTATATYARQDGIEVLLRGSDEQVDHAIEMMKDWFEEDPESAEAYLYKIQTSFLSQPNRLSDLLSITDLALKARTTELKASARVGFLYSLRAFCLLMQGRQEESIATLKKGIRIDAHGAVVEVTDVLITFLNGQKRYDDSLKLLVAVVIAAPASSDAVETALKQCVLLLDVEHKYNEALSYAKILFNVSSMAHTAGALAVLDRQLILTNMEDRSLVEKFRSEEVDGAAPISDGAQPRTSSVVLGIKIDATGFAVPDQSQNDDSFSALLVRTYLFLLADHAAEAMVVAQDAYGQAKDAKETAAAVEAIALCFKAEDGTIGRANAWIANSEAATNHSKHSKQKHTKTVAQSTKNAQE